MGINDEKRYQRIVFCMDEFGGTKEGLFEAVAQQLKLLLESNHVAVVRYDEPALGIVVIDFEHDEHYGDVWGIANPYWITEEELWSLENSDEEEEEENDDNQG